MSTDVLDEYKLIYVKIFKTSKFIKELYIALL